jgi:hypothetical protein
MSAAVMSSTTPGMYTAYSEGLWRRSKSPDLETDGPYGSPQTRNQYMIVPKWSKERALGWVNAAIAY